MLSPPKIFQLFSVTVVGVGNILFSLAEPVKLHIMGGEVRYSQVCEALEAMGATHKQQKSALQHMHALVLEMIGKPYSGIQERRSMGTRLWGLV